MKYPTRRYFTQSDKTLMWDRWLKGESLNSIARLLGTSHSAISGVFSKTGAAGGMAPGAGTPGGGAPGGLLGKLLDGGR